jgi:hypothetical protein
MNTASILALLFLVHGPGRPDLWAGIYPNDSKCGYERRDGDRTTSTRVPCECSLPELLAASREWAELDRQQVIHMYPVSATSATELRRIADLIEMENTAHKRWYKAVEACK